MKVFVDSSAWVALFDASDKYYQFAVNGLNQIMDTRIKFVTSDYIFDETATLLLKRNGQQQAVRFGKWVLTSANVDLIHVDEAVWQDAWDMFQNYKDKQWAFTDCTSFILMRQHNLHQAFTFDRHFEQAGFQLWPGMNEE
jgi:predicted nucleic acid-binding protein